jgi:ankyrin repeat protein
VVLVGCKPSQEQEVKDMMLQQAAGRGKTGIVKQYLKKGADVNAKDVKGKTPLDIAVHPENPNDTAETADLLRKHGGKTGEELKAEGK